MQGASEHCWLNSSEKIAACHFIVKERRNFGTGEMTKDGETCDSPPVDLGALRPVSAIFFGNFLALLVVVFVMVVSPES